MLKSVTLTQGDIAEVRYGYKVLYVTSCGQVFDSLEDAKKAERYFQPKNMFPRVEPAVWGKER